MTKTVLTVDDSRTMRDMLMLALKDAGYRVVQAEDGVHGLEVLQAENPDIVITDINMPGPPAGSSSRSTPCVWSTPCAAWRPDGLGLRT